MAQAYPPKGTLFSRWRSPLSVRFADTSPPLHGGEEPKF